MFKMKVYSVDAWGETESKCWTYNNQFYLFDIDVEEADLGPDYYKRQKANLWKAIHASGKFTGLGNTHNRKLEEILNGDVYMVEMINSRTLQPYLYFEERTEE